MDFPNRSMTHINERKAVNILTNYLPDEWVVREITERDYGVDLYVEIIDKDHKVTGDLVALQIKGTEEISFTNKNQYRFDGIKVSTYNYWCSLPVVVFLVVVDLKNKIPYWLNIKTVSREIVIKEGQETLAFLLHKDFCFDRAGLLAFKLTYLKEKRWPYVAKAILDSLTSYNTLGPLYLYCKRKKPSNISSSTIHYMLLRHYENFMLMQRYLVNEKPIDLPIWYNRHVDYIEQNNAEPTVIFYYATIMDIFDYFLDDYLKLIKKSYEVVTITEKDYWFKHNPYLVGHLIAKPLIFDDEDWNARYYFDEYENETRDISRCLFEDLQL